MISTDCTLRLQQPRASFLWKLPEMAAFLREVHASRQFTWMRRFGHPVPKPTEFYSNLPSDILSSLKRPQSKRKARLIHKTAKRFWESRKAFLKPVTERAIFAAWEQSSRCTPTPVLLYQSLWDSIGFRFRRRMIRVWI